MSHIHIPDGIVPSYLWITGYVITFIIMIILFRKNRYDHLRKKVPLCALMSAIMLISMSIPLGFLPVHIGLAVLSGIILGPSLGFVSVFTVNLILALTGHGGITIVGINTLILGAEVIIGYYIYMLLSKRIKIFISSFVSVFIAVAVSLTLMFGLMYTTGNHLYAFSQVSHTHEHIDEDHEDHEDHEEHEDINHIDYMGLTGISALMIILLSGLIIEALATGLITGFLTKVRPDILKKAKQ